MELRIGWGKSVPLPASAPTGSHSQERSVPTYAADAAIGTKGEELSDKEIEVSIPEDLHMRYVIDTLATFVLKDGAKFEQLIRQREAQNPAFAFLFEDGTAANVYYRWKLFTLVQVTHALPLEIALRSNICFVREILCRDGDWNRFI